MQRGKMILFTFALLFASLYGKAIGDEKTPQASSPTEQPLPKAQPVYVQQPHVPYSFFDAYNPYEALYPQAVPQKQQGSESDYVSAIIPATQVLSKLVVILQVLGALQFTLKALAKFGLFLLGGATLLLVGGIFTSILCYLTPFCVISFPGFNQLSKESVRSMMTPDKISAAAAMVQDAIGKYQRLQRAVGN